MPSYITYITSYLSIPSSSAISDAVLQSVSISAPEITRGSLSSTTINSVGYSVATKRLSSEVVPLFTVVFEGISIKVSAITAKLAATAKPTTGLKLNLGAALA